MLTAEDIRALRAWGRREGLLGYQVARQWLHSEADTHPALDPKERALLGPHETEHQRRVRILLLLNEARFARRIIEPLCAEGVGSHPETHTELRRLSQAAQRLIPQTPEALWPFDDLSPFAPPRPAAPSASSS